MLPTRIDRRDLFVFAAGGALASCRTPRPASARSPSAAIAGLERNGRLGVAVLDLGSGTIDGHRVDERFAMCSTFKLVLAAMVLQGAATGAGALDATVALGETDLVGHAPITRALLSAAVASGERSVAVSFGTLAHAAQTASDNAAANVLLREFGGPAAFNAFCRAHGDATTRLDRYEPEMNDVRPGDARDTTTPRAMACLVGDLLGGHGLAPAARATLRAWMIATETGAARVRRGLPRQWIAGDKTGTGGGSCTVKVNDVVWIEPPERAPLVVAAYYDTDTVAEWPNDEQQAVLAEVGRVVASA
ncbi:MAG: class A beta-lactamase [Planctomycetota bacterium]